MLWFIATREMKIVGTRLEIHWEQLDCPEGEGFSFTILPPVNLSQKFLWPPSSPLIPHHLTVAGSWGTSMTSWRELWKSSASIPNASWRRRTRRRTGTTRRATWRRTWSGTLSGRWRLLCPAFTACPVLKPALGSRLPRAYSTGWTRY